MNAKAETPFYNLPQKDRRVILFDAIRRGTDQMENFSQEATSRYSKKAYKAAISSVMKALTSKKGKGIVVYGDYDADGIISATILHTYLMSLAYRYRGDPDYIKIEFSNRQNSFGLTEHEYHRFLEDNSLIITVDNGSSLPFLSEETDGLLVLDHHPAGETPPYPYIINPNIGRNDGLVYSTSGGKVVYNFILNLEENLKAIDDDYPGNPLLMEVIRDLAAITLVSDMATLDKTNRNFLFEALESIRENRAGLPIYSLLEGDYSTRSMSFNIISPLNGMSRMESDLGVLPRWLIPNTENEWKEANRIVQANNRKKKKAVSQMITQAEEYIETTYRGEGPILIFYPKAKIGILGLIANKLSDLHLGTPTIVCAPNDEGGIVFSARGTGVKKVLGEMLENLGIPEDRYRYGGHPEACGGHISSEAVSQMGVEALVDQMHGILEKIWREGKLNIEKKKFPTIFSYSIGVSDAKYVQKEFAHISRGVDYHEKIYYLIENYEAIISKPGPSGWSNAVLKDPRDKKGILRLWLRPGMNELIDPEKSAIVMELTPNGDHAIHSILPKEEFGTMDEVFELILREEDESQPELQVEMGETEKEMIRKEVSDMNKRALPEDMQIEKKRIIGEGRERLPEDLLRGTGELFPGGIFQDPQEEDLVIPGLNDNENDRSFSLWEKKDGSAPGDEVVTRGKM